MLAGWQKLATNSRHGGGKKPGVMSSAAFRKDKTEVEKTEVEMQIFVWVAVKELTIIWIYSK